jgi:hypothetical protein
LIERIVAPLIDERRGVIPPCHTRSEDVFLSSRARIIGQRQGRCNF